MEIEKIYKRKLALESLARLWKGEQDDNQLNDSMLNRLLDEMGEVSFAMRKWWEDISKKYAWEYGSNCIWEIDFNTNEEENRIPTADFLIGLMKSLPFCFATTALIVLFAIALSFMMAFITMAVLFIFALWNGLGADMEWFCSVFPPYLQKEKCTVMISHGLKNMVLVNKCVGVTYKV